MNMDKVQMEPIARLYYEWARRGLEFDKIYPLICTERKIVTSYTDYEDDTLHADVTAIKIELSKAVYDEHHPRDYIIMWFDDSPHVGRSVHSLTDSTVDGILEMIDTINVSRSTTYDYLCGSSIMLDTWYYLDKQKHISSLAYLNYNALNTPFVSAILVCSKKEQVQFLLTSSGICDTITVNAYNCGGLATFLKYDALIYKGENGLLRIAAISDDEKDEKKGKGTMSTYNTLDIGDNDDTTVTRSLSIDKMRHALIELEPGYTYRATITIVVTDNNGDYVKNTRETMFLKVEDKDTKIPNYYIIHRTTGEFEGVEVNDLALHLEDREITKVSDLSNLYSDL